MYGFKTLELTEDEMLVLKMRTAGKSQMEVAAMLGVPKYRVNYLMGRATRKNAAKERLKIQGTRKLRF